MAYLSRDLAAVRSDGLLCFRQCDAIFAALQHDTNTSPRGQRGNRGDFDRSLRAFIQRKRRHQVDRRVGHIQTAVVRRAIEVRRKQTLVEHGVPASREKESFINRQRCRQHWCQRHGRSVLRFKRFKLIMCWEDSTSLTSAART
jgi:hypothetical protein